MEDRGDHQARRVGLLVLALLLVAGPAGGQAGPDDPYEPWNPTIDVSTGSDAVVVQSEVRGRTGGGGVRGSGSGSGSSCHLEPTNIGRTIAPEFWRRPANELPFFLWCDGRMEGLVWRAIGGGGGAAAPAPSPRDIAMQMRDRIPIPAVTIEINPERGLVGVESWFWIEGYDGEPITESSDAFGRRVDVEARVKRYEWSFGDGNRIKTESPGRAYPDRSDVRHTYERSSLGRGRGYPVEVGFFFSVRYRVDGGAWIDLPGIERVAEARYPVRESQAVIRR